MLGSNALTSTRGAIGKKCIWSNATGPAETVGQVGHLPYHFLVVHTGNDVCYDFSPR